MLKNLLLLFLLNFIFPPEFYAQTAKKIVVEHFTNTWCSTCASRNPGFYTNLATQSSIIHLAIHPSSPYPGCILNQHNITDNDGRTNYYSVYGSTPRLVIQGSVISSSTNYSSSSIFTPFIGQTSPASIRIDQTKYGADSIQARVVITTTDNHTLGALRLFIALAEDTIFYTGPNGEPQHYDVFRKSLSGIQGMQLNLPATIGDSIVFTFSSPSNPVWDFNRIYSLAILQNENNKSVVQSQSVGSNDGIITSDQSGSTSKTTIYPNPAGDVLYIKTNSGATLQYAVYNILGKLILNGEGKEFNKLDISNLYPGHYFIRVIEKGTVFTKQFIKY